MYTDKHFYASFYFDFVATFYIIYFVGMNEVEKMYWLNIC